MIREKKNEEQKEQERTLTKISAFQVNEMLHDNF